MPETRCKSPVSLPTSCLVRGLLAGIAALASWGGPLSGVEPPEPWEAGPFAADPVAVAEAASRLDASSDEGEAIILFSETRLQLEEDGRATRVEWVLYRIRKAEVDEHWSTLEAYWQPWHQERPQLRARVIAPDGAVHPLDPATITDAATFPEPNLFEDARVLRAPLPAIGPGVVVEQESIVRDVAPFFDRGWVEQRFLRSFSPVRHARLLVEAPEGLALRYVVRQLPDGGVQEETADGRRRLRFEYRDLSPYSKEIELWQPPDARWLSYVGISTGVSWADVARRYAEIVEQALGGADRAPELRKLLRAAKVPGSSRRETIDRLLALLGSEVRYAAVELGVGRIVPRSPVETLRRKFGDCKDKAALLIALLRELDIPAHVALLRSGEHAPEIEESLPGMTFNHAIVVVPGTPPLWIDPTDRYARAGELPVGDQGRLALIASATTEGLVRTPEASAADNRTVETREFFLADLGPARVVETTELWGEAERSLRAQYATQDEKSLREVLTGYLQSSYLTDQLSAVDHTDPVDLAKPFRLRLEAEAASRGYTDLQRAVVAVQPSVVLVTLPPDLSTAEDDDAKPRQSDYFLASPFRQETRYRAVPPEGFRPLPPPPGRVRQLGPATLSEEYTAGDDGTLNATLRFEIGRRRLTAEELNALHKGVREVYDENPVLLEFEQIGEAHLAAGRVHEALDEFRRLAGLAPQKALPRIHLSGALLAAGLGEAAREEVQRAVALEPSSALASMELAWTLQHDELGRRFGKGFDRAGALAAYRKAKELDPKEVNARANLAILLEHDAKGQRYTPGADLDTAIEEYRALRADLEDSSMDDNLLFALLWAGRFAEMKELLAQLEESPTRSMLRLAAVAATEGAAAAVREAERRLSDREARRTALAQAAQNLMQARRYAEAAALFEGAARQAPNAAAILTLVELLHKVRRHEELSFPLDQPANLPRQLFLLVLGSGAPDIEALKALFSRDTLREMGDDEKLRTLLDTGLAEFRSGFQSTSGVATDVALDLALGALRPTVSGDEAVGYRVVLTMMGAFRLPFYVVREGELYKLVVDDPSSYGREVLRRLEGDDLRGARQWLDWAREEAPAGGGDDPLAAAPIATLWTPGAEATADEARCAAASLMAGAKESADQAVPLLLSCRDAAPEGVRRAAFEIALAGAYDALGRFADKADAARRLLASFPRSRRAYRLLDAALTRLGRWDDLRRVAEERLAILPDDPSALLSLTNVAEAGGNLEEADRSLHRIVASGKADSLVFNNLAWLALVRGKADDQAIEHGQQAAQLEEYKDPSSLHTLASLYAEVGKTSEAYQLILQAMDLRPSKLPESYDWYVFGRLAEHYGLPEAARRYYTRVTPPEPGELEIASTYRLAQKRLAALDEAPRSKAH